LSPWRGVGGDIGLMTVDVRSDSDVYAAHASELVQFASSLVGPADAPDVVADAFIRLVRSPVWAHAEDRRALWFRGVVFGARSFHRSASRRRLREARSAAMPVASPLEPGPADGEIVDALEALSPQQRAAMFLTYWHDLDVSSVAELLGISAGAVKKHLARARCKLKVVLG